MIFSVYYIQLQEEILQISLIETETKPNPNRLKPESKGDINISVVVIGNFGYGDWESTLNSIA